MTQKYLSIGCDVLASPLWRRNMGILAGVVPRCHHAGMNRLIPAIMMPWLLLAPASVDAKNLRNLPAKIAKRCGTPPEWITTAGKDEVHLQPPPDADYVKVDCILRELQPKGGLKLGFVGNEADPNRVLIPGWSYLAGGDIPTLMALADEVRKAGWVAEPLAKADNGTGFLAFHTPEGMTEAQATPFATRLWKHELGEITFGQAPTRNGSGFDGE